MSDSNDAQQRAADALAAEKLAQLLQLYAAHQIVPDAVQRQMLVSHVRAMAWRSLTGEPLPAVEADLFDDISAGSLALAQQGVDLFGNLPPQEAWLLSVHIEVAKANTDSTR
ncbi:glycine dehydrogenase [Pantoea sp. 1.19]|uniref:glycine dehydrogenase n=1 Tax=Pantoea sp. 1.19 TaxID=1925589 RepID=UPI000948CA8D|nr:glycine dehydrogenase [Pantoea sp. 1.19]